MFGQLGELTMQKIYKMDHLLEASRKHAGARVNVRAVSEQLCVSPTTVLKYIDLPGKHIILDNDGVFNLYVSVGG